MIYCFIVQLILLITRCKIIPYVWGVLRKFKRKYKKYTKDLSKHFLNNEEDCAYKAACQSKFWSSGVGGLENLGWQSHVLLINRADLVS